MEANNAADDDPPPPTLMTLEDDLLLAVLAYCDIPTLGPTASSCKALAQWCDDEVLWRPLSQSQGLDTVAPKPSLQRAASCSHEVQQNSNAFEWHCDADATIHARCLQCHRLYTVKLAMGFVDTAAFSSKLVTRAAFTAVFQAPARHRSFEATWDRREAASAKAAQLQHAGQASGFHEADLQFFGTIVAGATASAQLDPQPARCHGSHWLCL